MTTYYTIRTDIWTMSLPQDWNERKDTDGKSLYFEAADGTKGIYVTTWTLGRDDKRPAEEIAGAFKAADLQSLQNMNGYSWKIVAEVSHGSDVACVTVTDCLATENAYRAVGKILSAPPILVKASFHDYACSDYAASQNYFSPIIDSLRFYEENA